MQQRRTPAVDSSARGLCRTTAFRTKAATTCSARFFAIRKPVGGLLISVAADRVDALLNALEVRDVDNPRRYWSRGKIVANATSSWCSPPCRELLRWTKSSPPPPSPVAFVDEHELDRLEQSLAAVTSNSDLTPTERAQQFGALEQDLLRYFSAS